MIANQWQRSSEFFKQPVQAGADARSHPFTIPQIIGLHLLRAIIAGLAEFFLSPRVRFDTGIATTSPDQRQLLQLYQVIFDTMYGSPILLTAASFFVALVFTTLFWQIGRAIQGAPVSFEAAQSSMLRYMLVETVLLAIVSLVVAVLPFFSLFASMLAIYFMVVFLLVAQGALELTSFWKTLLVLVLSGLALVGVTTFFSLILMMFWHV